MSLNMNNTNNIPDGSKPPMQNDPGVFTPYGTSPFYKFVTVCVSGQGIQIWESLPVPEIAEHDEDTYVENTIESYSVNVPYTTQADGESKTEFRIQNRKRTVQILKRRQPQGTEERLEEHTYTACVPYTCLLYTSPSPRDKRQSRMPSSA